MGHLEVQTIAMSSGNLAIVVLSMVETHDLTRVQYRGLHADAYLPGQKQGHAMWPSALCPSFNKV